MRLPSDGQAATGRDPRGAPSPPPLAPLLRGGGRGGAPTRRPLPPHTWRGGNNNNNGGPSPQPGCGNPGGTTTPSPDPQSLGFYGWGQRGDFPPSEDTENNLGTPQIEGGASPNGHLPGPPPGAPPNPEQILGARLRLLGDAFQHSYEHQRRGRAWLWGPLLRWVAPLAARGGN